MKEDIVVFCNGSFKSGSTWIFNILKELDDFECPPNRFLDKAWVNDSIKRKKVREFLQYHATNGGKYLSKNHLHPDRYAKVLLEYPKALVIHSERDLRDVIVSAFYHYKKRNQFSGDFSRFYWCAGRFIAHRWKKYNQGWMRAVGRPNFICITYEGLVDDFSSQLKKLAAFIGTDIDAEGIPSIYERTSIDTLRKKYKNRGGGGADHFRAGKTETWREYFTFEMEEDFACIMETGPPSGLYALYRFRDILNSIRTAAKAGSKNLTAYH